MNELKVGERFSVTLEIVEQNSCEPENRSDGKSIIFKEVKE